MLTKQFCPASLTLLRTYKGDSGTRALVLVRLRIDVNATDMIIETHNIGNIKVAEIIADKIILTSTEDGLELLGNLYYQGFDKIIIHEKNITPEFFDLKTKIAGNILQKFAQYQMPLIIVGDFSKYKSKSLNDFIFESNKGSQVNFVSDLSRVLQPV